MSSVLSNLLIVSISYSGDNKEASAPDGRELLIKTAAVCPIICNVDDLWSSSFMDEGGHWRTV